MTATSQSRRVPPIRPISLPFRLLARDLLP